jgi:hypothetical protein
MILVGFSSALRVALLGEADLSSAARALVASPFHTTLTKPIAEELMAKCLKLGFASAADLIKTQFGAL